MRRLLCAVFVLGSGCAAAPTTSRKAFVPIPLPDVEVATLSAQKTTLKAHLSHRPALLSLWATWCETCLTELGALGRLSQAAAEKGGYVVAVSEGEPARDVSAFVQQKALGYPQLVDERFALSDAIGARSVPTTLVVDRAGNIVFRGSALDDAALRAFDAVLGDK